MKASFTIRPIGLGPLFALFFVAASAGAQDKPSHTLDKIRGYGALYVGYAENAFPFSSLDASGQAVGFSLDLCRHVAEAVRERLALPHLEIVPVPASAGSMPIMVESGTLDLYCAASTNTAQQRRRVAFSVSTFAAPIRALVRRASGIASLAGLRGKLIVTTAGSSAEGHVRPAALRQKLALGYRLARDDDDALRQLLEGHADALVHDEVRLRRLLMSSGEADQLLIADGYFAVEPAGIVMRRGDAEFKRLVDEALVGLMKSGEFARLYARWFTRAQAPAGQSLDLPMSEILQQLVLTPNDKGI